MHTAPNQRRAARLAAAIAVLGLGVGFGHAVAGAAESATATCRAQTGARAPLVVELYTSEGCSSCPPADRWLSTLKGRADVLALGFHVNYWDRLGWPDRLARPEITERQYERNRVLGRPNVYTPQVIADGRDWPDWSRGLPPAPAAAAPQASLERLGARVVLRVATIAGAGALTGYWAVLEDGLTSRVRAGENSGRVLQHDHVVRRYLPLAPWRADAGTVAELTEPSSPGRRIAVVLADATGRPLQALQLRC
jgi:hypothetical protein